jgi:hypothetical protein
MIDFLLLLAYALTRLFRSRARLEAEILVLRQQLNILQCKSAERAVFKSIDRLVFAGLYRRVPGILDALKILKPETVRRAVQAVGRIVPNPHLGDLHHQYVRI